MNSIVWISAIPAFIIIILVNMAPHIPTGFFKNNWFKIAFASCSAFLIFWLVDDVMFWKILGAAFGFIAGWLVAKLFNKILSPIKSTAFSNTIKIILCILVVIFAFTQDYGRRTYENLYDDVFDKDPNDWTDGEKDYVNDLLGSID